MIEETTRKFSACLTAEDFDILLRNRKPFAMTQLLWADRADADVMYCLTDSRAQGASPASGLNGEKETEVKASPDRSR
jgi:hypothetical protein